MQKDHQLTVGNVRRDAVNLEFSQADLGEGVAEAVLVKVGMGVRLGKCGGISSGREGELDGTWVLTDGDMFIYVLVSSDPFPAWFDPFFSLSLKRLCAWNMPGQGVLGQ